MVVSEKKWAELTEKQQIIYDLYFNQNLKQKVIASRLKVSQQAVSKLIKKINIKLGGVLKESTGGCINRGMVEQKRTSYNPFTDSNQWRIEALSFKIMPYYFYPRYFKVMSERGNYSIPHKRWRIFLYKDVVRIQLKEDVYFRDPDRDKAIRAAEDDFNRFLYYAAQKYGFEYEKQGRISINCNNMEIEKENSRFAQGYVKQTGENYMQCRDVKGKVCFFIDVSKSCEHGYKGKDAYSHSENLEPYIKDFLYNSPLNNSQLTMRLNDTITAIEKLTQAVEMKLK